MTSRIAEKSLGRFWDRQGGCGVSRKRLGDQQDRYEVSIKGLRTGRIAVQFQGIVWGLAG